MTAAEDPRADRGVACRGFAGSGLAGRGLAGRGLAGGILALWLSALGCGSKPPPSTPSPPSGAEAQTPVEEAEPLLEPSPESAPAAESSPDATTAPVELEDDDLDADIAELQEEASRPDADPMRGRNVVYRVTPKGLVIEIDGIHLTPRAKAFKRKNGAYDIELTVTAKSFDGRQFWLKTPKEGPLSIAGAIETKQGERSRFGDHRRSDGEDTLVRDGEPVTITQRWPGKGQPKLWWGQTVTLEVGLWGLKVENGRERPVRKLFVVKMLGANRPQPVVSPPTMDWGS